MTDPTETALWASIEAAPEDGLRRCVLADYLEERAAESGGVVKCGCDDGAIDTGGFTPWGDPISVMCGMCDGTGRVSDGRAEMAAALRATVNYFPHVIGVGPTELWWYDRRNYDDDIPADHVPDHLPGELFDAIQAGCEYIDSDGQIAFKRFDTAADAIKALCRAYLAVHIKSEEPA